MVSARRLECRLAARARRHHLGRMGKRHRRSRTGVRGAVAVLADTVGRAHRSDQRRAAAAAHRSRLAAQHRLGVERRRDPADGAAAVSRVLPVLRRRRQAELPALSAQRRPLPRRAVQHRQLCAADPHDGRPGRAGRRRVHLDRRGLPHLRQPCRAGHASSCSREPRPYPELVLAPRDSIFDYTYDDIVIKNYDPHPAIKAPVAV